MSKTRKKTVKAAAKRKVTKVKRKAAGAARKVKSAARRKPAKAKKRATPKKRRKMSTAPQATAVHQIAGNALRLVDQAASLLRTGIRTSANQTEKARVETKRRALALVSKASEHLNKAVNTSSGGIRNIIGRI